MFLLVTTNAAVAEAAMLRTRPALALFHHERQRLMCVGVSKADHGRRPLSPLGRRGWNPIAFGTDTQWLLA
jgi:hypothetical protein